MGAVCSHPCTTCTIPLKALRSGDTSAYALRHPLNMANGVRRPPLLIFPSLRNSPSTMHNIIGVVKQMMDCFKKDLLHLDSKKAKGLPILLKEIPSHLDRRVKKPTVFDKCTLPELEKALTLVTTLVDKIQKANKNPSTTEKDTCEQEKCILSFGIRVATVLTTKMCKCAECLKWTHLICDGSFTIVDQDSVEQNKDFFVCYKCRAEELQSPLVFYTDIKLDIEDRISLKEIEAELELKTESLAKSINLVMKSLGVQPQRYHGGIFTGNDSKVILDNFHRIIEPLVKFKAENVAEKTVIECLVERYRKLAYCLKVVQSSTKYEYLSDQELTKLDIACASLHKLLLPAMSITPKVHYITVHTPKFARQWRSLKSTSEQFLEHLHVTFRQVINNYITEGKSGYRLAKAINAHNAKATIQLLHNLQKKST